MKPYIGKTGKVWELINAQGKVIATAAHLIELQSRLRAELAKR